MSVTEVSEISSVVRFIATEATDDDLNLIFTAFKARRKTLRANTALINQATLTPGTRVETFGLSPKYLNGLHAVVVAGNARRPGDLLINVDEADRYFVSGRRRFNLDALAVPASTLKAEV
jgi:hypothetical protein